MHLLLKIAKIREESPTFRTYIFNHGLRAKPGQWIMLWVPGVDELPMSVGWQEEREFHVGVSKVGDGTTSLFDRIKVGDRLGIRGPFGKPFELKEGVRHLVAVGGGFGTPPLLFLAKEACAKGLRVSVLLGGRSHDRLVYEKDFEGLGCEVRVATDDGTRGHHGLSTELLQEFLSNEKPDCIYSCGPERMMAKVAHIAQDHGIESQLSLERYMKCGFGVCGQCCIDPSGLRVCKDGPIVKGAEALKMKEFGHYTRTSSGRRVDLK